MHTHMRGALLRPRCCLTQPLHAQKTESCTYRCERLAGGCLWSWSGVSRVSRRFASPLETVNSPYLGHHRGQLRESWVSALTHAGRFLRYLAFQQGPAARVASSSNDALLPVEPQQLGVHPPWVSQPVP